MTNPHSAEQAARLFVSSASSKDKAAGGEQGSRDRLSLVSLDMLPVDTDSYPPAAPDCRKEP